MQKIRLTSTSITNFRYLLIVPFILKLAKNYQPLNRNLELIRMIPEITSTLI